MLVALTTPFANDEIDEVCGSLIQVLKDVSELIDTLERFIKWGTIRLLWLMKTGRAVGSMKTPMSSEATIY